MNFINPKPIIMNLNLCLRLSSIILLSFLISCSSKSTDDGDAPVVITIPNPVINSISSDFLLTGEVLIINGQNFIASDHQTQLLLNGSVINITPNSNSVIELSITENLGIEEFEVSVKVENKTSNSKDFFVIPKGWYKINTPQTDLDVVKAFSFNDTRNLVYLVDTQSADNSYYGRIRTLSPSETGYAMASISISDNLLDLEMYDENTGVATGSTYGYFSDNTFTSNTMFGEISIGLDPSISYVDETSCIIMNSIGKHVYTNDKGQSFSIDESPNYLSTPIANGLAADGVVKSIGKASDGDFYEVGFIFDRDPIGNYRNFIQKSDGYDNWTIVDSTTTYNGKLPFAKFINPNNILAKNDTDQQLNLSTDLGQTWSPIRDSVDEFFMRNEIEWYVVSGQNIFATEDSGTTWNLELELPTGSVVNNMQFSSSKIIISGNDGLLYIKHE